MKKVVNEKPMEYADIQLPAYSIGTIYSVAEAIRKDHSFVKRWHQTELPTDSYVFIVWEDDPKQKLRVFLPGSGEGDLLPYQEPTLWHCFKTTMVVALDRNPFTAIVGLPILSALSLGDWWSSRK
jgi:hypothetical protein